MSGLGHQVTIRDAATPSIVRMALAASSPRLLSIGGRAAANVWKARLVELNTERHRDGGRNYFYSASKSVAFAVAINRIILSANWQGLNQRLQGGTITAGANGSGKKWLPIAARDEAYGHRPGEFTDLHFVKFRNDLAALVQNQYGSPGTRGSTSRSITPRGQARSESLGGGIFYWLKPSVYQAPNPKVLPDDDQLTGAVVTAMEQALQRDQRN